VVLAPCVVIVRIVRSIGPIFWIFCGMEGGTHFWHFRCITPAGINATV
jgi:hypothetical protein